MAIDATVFQKAIPSFLRILIFWKFFVGRTFKKKILKTIKQVFRKGEVIGKGKVSQIRRKLSWGREKFPMEGENFIWKKEFPLGKREIPHVREKFSMKGEIPHGRGKFPKEGENSPGKREIF